MLDILPQDTPQKQCSKCKQPFPATAEYFYTYKDKFGTVKLFARCKECEKDAKKKYRQEHHDKALESDKKYRHKYQDSRQKYNNKYRQEHRNELIENNRKYHREHRDKLIEQCKKYRQDHIYDLREYDKKYRQERHDDILVKDRKYYREHRNDVLAKKRKYRQYHRDKILDRQKKHYYANRDRLNALHREYSNSDHGMLVMRANNQSRRARKKSVGGSYTAQQVYDQLNRQKHRCYYCKSRLTSYHIDHIVPISRGGSNTIDNIVLACPTCNLKKHARLLHEWHDGGRLL